MPRQSRGRAAPARPAPKPAASVPQQHRPAATHAATPYRGNVPTPQPPAAAPPTQSQGPGLFGQMASTAAGVAVGSSIGHAVGSLFTGGGSSGEADAHAAPAAPAQVQQQQQQQPPAFGQCQAAFNMFSQCMDQNGNDGNACQWYWHQLKSCQEANQ